MATEKRGGFTLLELMTVVALLGVLAAIAIPAYLAYIRRSKASEVALNLNGVYKSMLNYYSLERSSQGVAATAAGACVIDDAAPSPADPSSSKQPFVGDAQFVAIGYLIPEPVFFSYGVFSVRSTLAGDCGAVAISTASVYTIYAHGDLDNDNILSTYEMVVGSNGSNQLYHSPGFYSELPDE